MLWVSEVNSVIVSGSVVNLYSADSYSDIFIALRTLVFSKMYSLELMH